MNRRQFLAGLLASTAAAGVPAFQSDLDKFLSLLRVRDHLTGESQALTVYPWQREILHTLVYGTDEAPTEFTGHFVQWSNVHDPNSFEPMVR